MIAVYCVNDQFYIQEVNIDLQFITKYVEIIRDIGVMILLFFRLLRLHRDIRLIAIRLLIIVVRKGENESNTNKKQSREKHEPRSPVVYC